VGGDFNRKYKRKMDVIEREKIMNELFLKVADFLKVAENNKSYENYDKLINIFISYRGRLSIDELNKTLGRFQNDFDLSDYQDDMLYGFATRLARFCPAEQEIEWW
jgi:hypothetical protein